jgi:transcriptional regulator with GAF, ATPase, and Fis domain
MPALIAKLEGGERRFELVKMVTSIGRDAQNDVHLDAAKLEPRHAHVVRDKNGHRLFAAEGAKVFVNGKRRDEHILQDGDVIELGALKLVFRATPAPERKTEPPRPAAPEVAEKIRLEAFKRLHTFTVKLSASPNLEVLKRNLVDLVIELAGAESGFMILLRESGSTAIDVARDKLGNDLPKEGARVSESIVAQVAAEKKPILITDALEDTFFGESNSVINFRIRSVVAVPILRGDEALGVLWLGSDRLLSGFSQDWFDVLMVFAAHAALLIEKEMLIDTLREDNQALKAELSSRTFGEIVGGCPSMQEVFRAVSRLAPADISVMILGETGTGKELIAHELHRRSPRSGGPFVAINVSAIPENLLEAELFGYVKGAFTGAISDRKGKFMAADGGTLFLDEIGDMPLGLQAKLLRVLQDRAVERIGSNQAHPLDIRVVSATNRDLDEMQADGRFRADLYFRLNEAQITLPPLRDRGEDIVLLATYFLTRYNEKLDRKIRRFTPRALAGMKRYPWPGNVRELEAKVKKAVVMCETNEIELADLGIEEKAMEQILPLKEAKERYALQYIREVLELNAGNRSKTARDLEIDPRTVFKYLEGK